MIMTSTALNPMGSTLVVTNKQPLSTSAAVASMMNTGAPPNTTAPPPQGNYTIAVWKL